MGTQSKEWTDIGFRALALAWSDERFMRALLEDPRAALEEYFHYTVPKNMNIVITDGDAAPEGALHLILSPKPTDLMDGRVQSTVNPETLQAKPCICCLC